MSFDGFDPDVVALLAELPTWGGDDYADHKARLVAGVTRPGRALITEVADRLGLATSPRRSVSPLHRDLRFAAAGSPRYKDHLLLTAWEGDDKLAAPTVWIRLDADRAGFASGIAFSPAVRARWRAAVGGDDGAELARALDSLAGRRHLDVAGERTKRVPAPFDDDHPRADLLRRTGFQVRVTAPLPDTLATPAFAGWCVGHLTTLLPIHRWLVEHLT